MRQKGFTLIELLIVVAIIGIIAAVAIPNMLDAVERARQKRATGEIKGFAHAIQGFKADYAGYPNVARSGQLFLSWRFNDASGRPAVIPDYIQAVPECDPWEQTYWYLSGPDGRVAHPQLGQTTADHYIIVSLGSDGGMGGPADPGSVQANVIWPFWCANPPIPLGTLATHCYQTDIVWGDSSFLQCPDGKQKKC
jgi:general secretion pathway protein G